ncbi:MAG: hypothetical protein Q9168_004551 [Polycauliona sp. 1 TL-2023]
MRKGQTQQWLYLRGQVRQILNRSYLESQVVRVQGTDSDPLKNKYYDDQEIEELVTVFTSRKNYWQAETILEEVASTLRDHPKNIKFSWCLDKLVGLYIQFIARIKSTLESKSHHMEQIALISILDSVARIDFDDLTYRAFNKDLIRLEKVDLGAMFYLAVAHNACNLARIVLDGGAHFAATPSGSLIHDFGTSDLGFYYPNEPLHLAVGFGYIDMVMFLVSRGADIEARSDERKDSDDIDRGRVPLHTAVQAGKLTMVMCLLSLHANIEARCKDLRTPLMWAASKGNTDIVRYLLDGGAGVDQSDNNGKRALHFAALAQRPANLRILVRFTLDIMARDSKDRTALHSAIQDPGSEMIECIDILVANGVDIDAKDCGAATALHRASWSGNSVAAEHLIKRGASLWTESFIGTPLHHAVGSFLWDEDRVLTTINVLLQYGADINSQTSDGMTPLHVASQYSQRGSDSYLEIIQTLCHKGADVSIRDKQSKTALDYTIGNEAATTLLTRYLPRYPMIN